MLNFFDIQVHLGTVYDVLKKITMEILYCTLRDTGLY